jgi:hypothetical protein
MCAEEKSEWYKFVILEMNLEITTPRLSRHGFQHVGYGSDAQQQHTNRQSGRENMLLNGNPVVDLTYSSGSALTRVGT